MKITRRQLRGSPLLPMCYPANLVDKWDFRKDITICQCFGRYDASNDEPLDECRKCMAWNRYEDWRIIDRGIREIKEGAK